MKLYIVVCMDPDFTIGFGPPACGEPFTVKEARVKFMREERCEALIFTTAEAATEYHEQLRHGIAKKCKVVEIEIPDEDA